MGGKARWVRAKRAGATRPSGRATGHPVKFRIVGETNGSPDQGGPVRSGERIVRAQPVQRQAVQAALGGLRGGAAGRVRAE
ncbi:hypothetical protein GCM10017784_32890 [Deinococcus indicus]|nr:hypothetical protein GCM10017784_32890 [Deinococcus indicus]